MVWSFYQEVPEVLCSWLWFTSALSYHVEPPTSDIILPPVLWLLFQHSVCCRITFAITLLRPLALVASTSCLYIPSGKLWNPWVQWQHYRQLKDPGKFNFEPSLAYAHCTPGCLWCSYNPDWCRAASRAPNGESDEGTFCPERYFYPLSTAGPLQANVQKQKIRTLTNSRSYLLQPSSVHNFPVTSRDVFLIILLPHLTTMDGTVLHCMIAFHSQSFWEYVRAVPFSEYRLKRRSRWHLLGLKC